MLDTEDEPELEEPELLECEPDLELFVSAFAWASSFFCAALPDTQDAIQDRPDRCKTSPSKGWLQPLSPDGRTQEMPMAACVPRIYWKDG